MNSTTLFTPVQVGPIRLSSRIVMAPMTRNRAQADLTPGPMTVRYYAQRAGAGLIVTEGAQVSPQGIGYVYTPGIHTPAQVARWREVTDAVHARGGRIFVQLWHVGRASHPSLQPGGALPVAPSAIAPEGGVHTYGGFQPYVAPRALGTDEIAGIVDQFRHAARCAAEAGFDGVEVHGANGYLVDQFLQDGTNRRTDRYGGSLANRARLLLEITEAVAAVRGADRVGVRLSPASTYLGMSDSDPAATFGHAAAALDRLGLAYLHVIEPRTPLRVEGRAVSAVEHLRSQFRGPIIANGGFDGDTAGRLLAAGTADLVSFGRLFIANPDLPERLRVGAPLAPPDSSTFYGGDERGYIDYPTLAQAESRAA